MDRRTFGYQILGSCFAAGAIVRCVEAAPKLLGTSKIQWQKNLKAAQKLAMQQDKPMMIVFGASWCTYCHKLERETLGDKRISSVIDREFIPVHLDYDKDSKIAKILEVERLPCTIFLAPNGDLLFRTEGFENVKEFQATLTTVMEKQSEIEQVGATKLVP